MEIKRERKPNETYDHWSKRWFVLDESALQVFKGQSNASPKFEIQITEEAEVHVAPKGEEIKPFVFCVKVPSTDAHDSFTELRLHAHTKPDFDSWIAAFSVAIDRAKHHAAEERQRLGQAAAQSEHPLLN